MEIGSQLTQHDSNGASCHRERVLKGLANGVVSVHRNAIEVEDGRGAEVDVEGVPEVTGHLIK